MILRFFAGLPGNERTNAGFMQYQQERATDNTTTIMAAAGKKQQGKKEKWSWNKTWTSITTDERDDVAPPYPGVRLWWHIGLKGAQAGTRVFFPSLCGFPRCSPG